MIHSEQVVQDLSLPRGGPKGEALPPELLTKPTRRLFLQWLSHAAALATVSAVVPLTGCGPDDDVKQFGDSPDETIRRYGEKYPDSRDNVDALIELNSRDKDEEDAESGDSHGTLRCWKDLLHPKKWLGNHWDNLAMSTAAGLGPQMFPGDSDFENGLARFLAGTMTVFNGFTRGIVAPETVYAFFLTLWGKWSGIFSSFTSWRRGGGE